MPRIPRNYISEISKLGVSHRDIATQLNVPIRQVHHWASGKFKPPKSLYEPIRNITRKTVYRYLRQAGYPSSKASGFRRLVHPEAVADVDWLNMIIDTLYKDWNSSYLAYMRNPKKWIEAHPNRKIPQETSRDEVKRRIEKGIKRGKSKEEIENY